MRIGEESNQQDLIHQVETERRGPRGRRRFVRWPAARRVALTVEIQTETRRWGWLVDQPRSSVSLWHDEEAHSIVTIPVLLMWDVSRFLAIVVLVMAVTAACGIE